MARNVECASSNRSSFLFHGATCALATETAFKSKMYAESLNRNRRGRDRGFGRHGIGVGESAACEGTVVGIFVAADWDGGEGRIEGLFR